jgi:nucleotide-binding universal stress UspA family protein
MIRRILLATDGAEGSEGAFRFTRALAERDGATVSVITVIEPVPLYGVGTMEMAPIPDPGLERARAEGQRKRVADQVQRMGSEGWETQVETGAPARVIPARARGLDADLIVMGLGDHEAADRWLGSETALKVMRLADRPVLGAHRTAGALPRTAVVAADFSIFSERAATLAAALVGPEGRLELVHASPGTGDEERERGHRAGVEERMQRLAGAVQGPQVSTDIVHGDPGRTLLERAEEIGADLIAAGSHGHGFFGRMLMGSVSTRLVRGAHCSVLIAPPQEGEETE